MNAFLETITQEFSKVKGFENKYMLLLKLARNGEFLDQTFCNDQTQVLGCEAKVWINAETKDGRKHFLINSDSRLIKSIIWIVAQIANESDQSEKVDYVSILLELGLGNVVSQSRQNGILNIQKAIEKELKL